MILRFLVPSSILFVCQGSFPCVRKTFTGSGPSDYRMACICNSTYCDDVEPVGDIRAVSISLLAQQRQGSAVLYTSSLSGKRLERTTGAFDAVRPQGSFIFTRNALAGDVVVTLNASRTFQEITGFGGAFTDATGYNVFGLSAGSRANFLKSHFGDNGQTVNHGHFSGLQYTLGRVPMASVDFSTRVYSYDDVVDDFELKNFALADEDTVWKVFKYSSSVADSHDPGSQPPHERAATSFRFSVVSARVDEDER